MAQPLICRWAIVGLPESEVAKRFISDTISLGQASTPIQHHVTALASCSAAPDSDLQQAWQDALTECSASSNDKSRNNSGGIVASSSGTKLSSIQTKKPEIASSADEIAALSTVDCLLLGPTQASSESLLSWATAALSKGKSVLIPRPTSLQLSSQHAATLTELAREKRSWLGIIVKKRVAQGKGAKRAANAAVGLRPSTSVDTQLTIPASEQGASSSASTSLPQGSGSPPLRSQSTSTSLRWAVDECARCRERGIFESSMIGWDENIALLECIEEIRAVETTDSKSGSSPKIPAQTSSLLGGPQKAEGITPENAARQEPTTAHATPSLSQSDQSKSTPTSALGFQPDGEIDIAPRRFPKTPAPAPGASAIGEESTTTDDAADTTPYGDETMDSDTHGFTDSPSVRKSVLPTLSSSEGDDRMRKEILQLKHLLRQKQAEINALIEEGRHERHSTASDHSTGPESSSIAQPQGRSSSTESGSSSAARTRKTAVRLSLPPKGYAASNPLNSSRLPRRRDSSIGGSKPSTPTQARFPTVGSVPNGLTSSAIEGSEASGADQEGPAPRNRKNAGPTSTSVLEPLKVSKISNLRRPSVVTAGRRLSSPGNGNVDPGSPNTSGGSLPSLTKSPDRNDGATSPGAVNGSAVGFLAPTRASEKRRLATLQEQQSQDARSTSTSPGGSPLLGGGRALSPDPLVSRLAHELDSTRGSLDSTRQQLASSQRNLASLQRMYDSTKESVASARLEAERKETQLARKDKMLSEALERARKAEAEVKELGRSSREWGSRVRSVEAELGEVRRQTARAESAYEALRSACASNKAKWEGEVAALRSQLHDVVKEHKRKAESALSKFEMVEEEWKGREGQRKGLEAVLEGLALERGKARRFVVEEVARLVQRVEEGEKFRLGQEGSVQEVRDELSRLLRLMRSGEVDQNRIRTAIPTV